MQIYKKCSSLQKAVIVFAVMLLALLHFASCRTQREAQTERTEYVHLTDTLREVRTRIDSVVIKDSVVAIIKGDTVRIERWRDRWHRSADTDTVERWKVRNIYRTRTVTITPPPLKLPWYQKVLQGLGILSLLGLTLVAAMALRRWKNR